MAREEIITCDQCGQQAPANHPVGFIAIAPIGQDFREVDGKPTEGEFCSPECVSLYLVPCREVKKSKEKAK